MSQTLPDRPASDADAAAHRAAIAAAVAAYIESLKIYVDELWKKYRPQTRIWQGTCRSINLTVKTATVDLDPFPESGAQPGVVASWGRPRWTAAQLVNKRVRVLIDEVRKTMWIDDVLS